MMIRKARRQNCWARILRISSGLGGAALLTGLLSSCESKGFRKTEINKGQISSLTDAATLGEGVTRCEVSGAFTALSAQNSSKRIKVSLNTPQSQQQLFAASSPFSYTIENPDIRFARELSLPLRLVFESEDGSLMGISPAIVACPEGKLTLGGLALDAPGSLAGQLRLFQRGGAELDATVSDARISLGRSVIAQAGSGKGSFNFNRLPIGDYNILIEYPGYETLSYPITVSREPVSEPLPIYLMPSGLEEPFGVMKILPQKNRVYDPVNPLRRTVSLFWNRAAASMRYGASVTGSDKSAGAAIAENATWHSLAREFVYDFGRAGYNTLHYQFRHANEQKLGEIYTLNLLHEVFAPTTGIRINQGSLVTQDLLVEVSHNAPAEARLMRLSDDIQKLGQEPWQPIAPTAVFRFKEDTPLNSKVMLYGQFKTLAELESPVYSTTISYEPFWGTDVPAFEVVKEQFMGFSQLVDLEIKVPRAAYEMRLYEETLSGGNRMVGDWVTEEPVKRTNLENQWLAVTSHIQFLFIKSGRQTIYLQFRTKNGQLSPIYKQEVDVRPFNGSAGEFTINDGAPYAASRVLSIKPQAPYRAKYIRIGEYNWLDYSEPPEYGTPVATPGSYDGSYGGSYGAAANPSPIGLGSLINHSEFVMLKPAHTYVVKQRLPGYVTLYVQYMDIDETTSPVYSNTIFIDPYLNGQGSFTIGDGSVGVMRSHEFLLNLTPPGPEVREFRMRMADASSLAPYEAPDGHGESGTGYLGPIAWQPIAPTVKVAVKGRGQKTVYLQYRNALCDETNVLQRSFYYDPFYMDPGRVELQDNAKVVKSPILKLNISPPMATTAFFITTDVNAVPPYESSLWRAPQPGYIEFELERLKKDAGNEAHSQTATLYTYFRNAVGDISDAVATVVTYDPFYQDIKSDMLTLPEVVKEPEVVVTLKESPPVHAVEWSVTVEPLSLLPSGGTGSTSSPSSGPCTSCERWEVISSSSRVPLPNLRGYHTVVVKFRNYRGEESIALRKRVLYDPFYNDAGSMVINNNELVTLHPILDVKVTPPEKAVEMQYHIEGMDGITNKTVPVWTPVSDQTFRIAIPIGEGKASPDEGLYRIAVKFRTVNNLESATILEEICYGSTCESFATAPASSEVKRVPVTLRSIVDGAAFWSVSSAEDGVGAPPPEKIPVSTPTIDYLCSKVGRQWLKVQLYDSEGRVKRTAYLAVNYQPFPDGNGDFTILGLDAEGAISASEVSIKLLPPPQAVQVKILLGNKGSEEAPLLVKDWFDVSSLSDYIFKIEGLSGAGMKEIIVVYRNKENTESEGIKKGFNHQLF
jgi:hypothetical protein